MKSSKKPLIITIIAAVGIVVAVTCPSRTRTDSLTIRDFDEGYEVVFYTGGHYLWPPISPEGPFPKWGSGTILIAKGPGNQVARDGVLYKHYTLGDNLECGAFSSGEMHISEVARKLIVEGKLLHYREINHSGTYNNITINRPKIIPLTDDSKIEDLDGHYIRARGRFKDMNFEAAGKKFYSGNKAYENSGNGEYDVVGRVSYYPGQIHKLGLYIIFFDRVAGR